ncbi:MAG: hypothetical protein MUF15_09205 [Acidobacteria bacterium]|jgi:hypothetical protein|nr:hypothetical protein [Acidobacteriota bacterium]
MQTLHIQSNEQVMTQILDFIDNLSRRGAEIEILDNQIYDYEKQKIDQALQDIENGKVYSLNEVEKELLNIRFVEDNIRPRIPRLTVWPAKNTIFSAKSATT